MLIIIKQRLHELGCTVLDPWEGPFHTAIAKASAIQDWPDRVAAFKAIATQIGKANEDMIRSCDIVLGVPTGRSWIQAPPVKLDSPPPWERSAMGCQTISEILGIAMGFPSTWRFYTWVQSNGGKFYRSIDEIVF